MLIWYELCDIWRLKVFKEYLYQSTFLGHDFFDLQFAVMSLDYDFNCKWWCNGTQVQFCYILIFGNASYTVCFN